MERKEPRVQVLVSAVTLDKLVTFPALVCGMIRTLPTSSLSGSFTSLTGAGWPKLSP